MIREGTFVIFEERKGSETRHMLWIKRRFALPDNWADTDLMDKAEKLVTRFPHEFMMVEEKHESLDSTIWVRLPAAALRGMFPGFTNGQVEDIQMRPVILAADNTEFNKAFGALPGRDGQRVAP